MTILPQRAEVDQTSFEQAHKNYYSHGFEKIYKLVDIDPNSVRTIVVNKSINPDAFVESQLNPKETEIQQFEFNFVNDNANFEAFVLREPIQVLGLTRRIESLLLSQQKLLVKDLLDENHALVPLSGLGFGHLDELQVRLQEHLKGKVLNNVRRIDLCSWVRTLIGDIDFKKAHILLEAYGLAELITLTTAEAIEVRRASPHTLKIWREEGVEQLKTKAKIDQFNCDMRYFVNTSIIPWIESRQGIATEIEIQEYVLSISESGRKSEDILRFFTDMFGNETLLMKEFLIQADHELLCSSKKAAADIAIVLDIAQSYFYKSDLSYTLVSLVDWISRECAKNWCGFADGFIEKVLRISSRFRVRRGPCGHLKVKSVL